MFGGFTFATFALGWGWVFGACGLLLTALSAIALIGTGPDRSVPHGAIPVRCELELDSAEGDAIRVRIIAVVRVATEDDRATLSTELYGGRSRDDVGAAATAMLESVVRSELGRRPRADLAHATLLDLASPGTFKDAFARMALHVDSLWVGPA